MPLWKDDAYVESPLDPGDCSLAAKFGDVACGEEGSGCASIGCQAQADAFNAGTTKTQLVAPWIVVDPITGGQKGQKDVQLSMVPPKFLEDLGRIYAMGAAKYARNNWRKGYKWSLSADALYRHWLEVLKGNWLDEESGLPHVCHIAWHCATLHTFQEEGLGENDLY